MSSCCKFEPLPLSPSLAPCAQVPSLTILCVAGYVVAGRADAEATRLTHPVEVEERSVARVAQLPDTTHRALPHRHHYTHTTPPLLTEHAQFRVILDILKQSIDSYASHKMPYIKLLRSAYPSFHTGSHNCQYEIAKAHSIQGNTVLYY